MTYQYIPFMAKIIRAQRAKKALVRSVPKKSAKAKSKVKAKAQKIQQEIETVEDDGFKVEYLKAQCFKTLDAGGSP
jgi:hypothetical protein